MMKSKSIKKKLWRRSIPDIVGVAMSLLCMVHCFFVPIFLGASSFSMVRYHSDSVEGLFVAIALLIALVWLPNSYRKHSNRLPLVLFLVGVGIVVFSEFFGSIVGESIYRELGLVLGACSVGIAHGVNFLISRKVISKKPTLV